MEHRSLETGVGIKLGMHKMRFLKEYGVLESGRCMKCAVFEVCILKVGALLEVGGFLEIRTGKVCSAINTAGSEINLIVEGALQKGKVSHEGGGDGFTLLISAVGYHFAVKGAVAEGNRRIDLHLVDTFRDEVGRQQLNDVDVFLKGLVLEVNVCSCFEVFFEHFRWTIWCGSACGSQQGDCQDK
jgi:hypothetical protein